MGCLSRLSVINNMIRISGVLSVFLFATVASSADSNATSTLNATEPKNSTFHIYLLLVPDKNIEALKQKARTARQEEVVTGTAQALAGGTANYVSQIVGGVLVGDVRGVLAGTTGFLPEGDIRDNVGGVLLNQLAPVINRLIMDVTQAVVMRLNSTTSNPLNNNNNNNNNNNQYQQQQQQQPVNDRNQQRQPVNNLNQQTLNHNQYNQHPQQVRQPSLSNFNQYELPRSPPTPPPSQKIK